MSFSWKGLLGVGGSSSSANSNIAAATANSGLPFTTAEQHEWARHADDPLDLPNVLGMENFGNTCYVNSVMQALYFCEPFRESLLVYNVATLKTPKSQSIALPLTPTRADFAPNRTINGVGAGDQPNDSLFYALRTLFQRMATASVPSNDATGDPAPTATTMSPSTSSSTSYLGAGLSRKVSSRPGTANKQSASAGIASASASGSTAQAQGQAAVGGSGIGGGGAGGIAQGTASSCSNIVVPDADIKAFLSLLKKSNNIFDSTAHQDAHELLNFVLNRVGEDIVDEAKADGRASLRLADGGRRGDVHGVEANGKTLVHRLFEGILTSETRCLTCESVTSRDECFLDLSLDIERNTSVTGCLRQFSASEMLCARNKFFCDTCSGLQEAEKRMKIKKLPNVLALHLKRFKYEESLQRFVKLAYRVVFPMQLRLDNTSDDAQDPDKLYELYGIIVHIGIGPHHGHYIAIIKVGQRWFVFDDETISVIDEVDITRYFGDTPGVGSAYVLFYQAVDVDMQGLGLPDIKAMRSEKARLRRDESIRKHFSVHAQQQQSPSWPTSNGHAHAATPGSEDGSAGVMSFDLPPPPRTTTPSNDGWTGALFGRRHNSVSQQTAPPGVVAAAAAAAATDAASKADTASAGGSLPMTTSVSEQGGESNKTGSWLSSLRSRKPSAALAVSTGLPSGFGRMPVQTSPGGADDGGQSEEEGVSANNKLWLSPNDREHRVSASPVNTSRQRSPVRPVEQPGMEAVSNGHGHDGSPVKSPSLAQGAAFVPADRPLNKKEQEKIARQARRKGSVSSGPGGYVGGLSPKKSFSVLSPEPRNGVQDAGQQGNAAAAAAAAQPTAAGLPTDGPFTPPPHAANDTLPTSTSSGGWRRVASAAGRRPSTADPTSDLPTRRRSTLSRTFGFGRKDKA